MDESEPTFLQHRLAWFWYYAHHPRLIIEWMLGVEWTEARGQFPHCCTQAQCWMHIEEERRWCRCWCRWCLIARRIRR